MTSNIVMILDKSDKNFNARMNKSIAYVFNKEGTCLSTWNMKLVNLNLLKEKDDIMILKALIQ